MPGLMFTSTSAAITCPTPSDPYSVILSEAAESKDLRAAIRPRGVPSEGPNTGCLPATSLSAGRDKSEGAGYLSLPVALSAAKGPRAAILLICVLMYNYSLPRD